MGKKLIPKKYVKRDGYVGVFQYVDRGGFWIYRFPRGVCVVSEWESENFGADTLEELEDRS